VPDDAAALTIGDREVVEAALAACCNHDLTGVSPPVAMAIRYSLLGQGKRFRGLLVLASYRAAGGVGDASGLAAAVEVVHAYSLVHDDLPCMDNDDMRRGRPTVHRAFDVEIATAAGVTMVPLAARRAYQASRELGTGSVLAGRIVGELMTASGAGGMIGGQLLDLLAEGQRLGLEELEQVHRAKTGTLISASARIGAMAASADDRLLVAFTHFGDALGLAYQIADDVLDVTATSDQLGKTAGKDVANAKSTYPLVMGIDEARRRAGALVNEACGSLEAVGRLTPDLERLARHVVERQS
jgi:farnesyl diphosphate synthase/geranylgeranyl diphosphate synthase type II